MIFKPHLLGSPLPISTLIFSDLTEWSLQEQRIAMQTLCKQCIKNIIIANMMLAFISNIQPPMTISPSGCNQAIGQDPTVATMDDDTYVWTT
jgi:hypothetical protein